MTPGRPHILVVDPAMRRPELECLNWMALVSPLPVTYHLPVMHGMQSLELEDMASARGIVLLGSASSVNERLPWQEPLEAWLRPHLERRVPTLGICYGHQMLAHMFGGKIDYVHENHFKHLGFRDIAVDATSCWPAGKGPIVVSHNEMVVAAPPGMQVIARSPLLDVEGLAHTTLPIWTFQAHPEATQTFLRGNDIELDPAKLPFGQRLVTGFLAFAAKAAGPA